MGKYWLAINYGAYGGWYLEGPFESGLEALKTAMSRGALGDEWKIIKEVEFADNSVCQKEE